jgi:aryl-alcohol dehydrogenase-like predicted oxidoreductase
MERRRLGRTGHQSSVAILGAAAYGLHLALDRGVNHLDIAPSYGRAEEAVGPHVAPVRDRLFVAAKTMRKNPDGVRAQLDESRRRLGCDVVDLYQAHAVTSTVVLDERSAAIETIVSARDAGLTRFAGVTGHDFGAPKAFLEALRRFDLDTVMFAVYPRLWADPAYRADAEELLATCIERDIGVMAIKAAARRPWQADATDRPASPWYEPWRERDRLERGIRFALSMPGVHAFCTPGDLSMLPTVLDVAEHVTPMDVDERDAVIDAMAGEEPIFPIPA